MPRKIKDENGNDVEVFSQEEIDAAKAEATKSIHDKLGIKEGDDADKIIDETVSKAKERADWEKVSGGKEKTKKEAQQKVLDDLKEKGVEAKFDEDGKIVIDADKQAQTNSSITIEQAEEAARNAANQAVKNSDFEKARDVLISGLDKTKQEDVKSYINDLREKGVEGDVNQLFNMSIASLGVETPSNMGNNQAGYPNGLPNNMGNQQEKRTTDMADTPRGEKIMKEMGMLDSEIAKGKELKGKGRIIQEGKIVNNDDGAVGTEKDVIA